VNGAIIPLLAVASPPPDGNPYGNISVFGMSGWNMWPVMIVKILPIAIAIFIIVHLRRRGMSRRATVIWSGAIALPALFLSIMGLEFAAGRFGFSGHWVSGNIGMVMSLSPIVLPAGLVIGAVIAIVVAPSRRGWGN